MNKVSQPRRALVEPQIDLSGSASGKLEKEFLRIARDGGGRDAMFFSQLSGPTPPRHLRPEIPRSSLCCTCAGELSQKVPPYPLQRGGINRLLSTLLNRCNLYQRLVEILIPRNVLSANYGTRTFFCYKRKN